jgi:GNAT superfamily N-acetyltransferase
MKTKIEELNRSHNRDEFNCGYDSLNNYIKKQANQDIKRNLAACYVLFQPESKIVIGYYTLSANSIDRNILPLNLSKRLPLSYSQLPSVLLGRLAVSRNYKGNGFGKILLIDAFIRCFDLSERLGIMSVIVDPIDEEAKIFYTKFGFILLPGSGKMFIPIKTIKELI